MKINKKAFNFIIIILFCVVGAKAQDDGFSPQIWNNIYVGWNINERLVLRNSIALNVLLNKTDPWNEFSYSGNIIYKINSFIEGSTAMYFASTRQTKQLNSVELRPFVGIRFSTKPQKRWFLTNISRLEFRNFWYSKGNNDLTLRFRNRTSAAFCLNKKTLAEDNNLSIYGYIEPFYNFENNVTERFFTQLKFKVGFIYRFSFKWRLDVGLLYQDTKNNSGEISISPTNIITNYIFDWGIVYIFPSKKTG